jgi:hypothetical protein
MYRSVSEWYVSQVFFKHATILNEKTGKSKTYLVKDLEKLDGRVLFLKQHQNTTKRIDNLREIIKGCVTRSNPTNPLPSRRRTKKRTRHLSCPFDGTFHYIDPVPLPPQQFDNTSVKDGIRVILQNHHIVREMAKQKCDGFTPLAPADLEDCLRGSRTVLSPFVIARFELDVYAVLRMFRKFTPSAAKRCIVYAGKQHIDGISKILQVSQQYDVVTETAAPVVDSKKKRNSHTDEDEDEDEDDDPCDNLIQWLPPQAYE